MFDEGWSFAVVGLVADGAAHIQDVEPGADLYEQVYDRKEDEAESDDTFANEAGAGPTPSAQAPSGMNTTAADPAEAQTSLWAACKTRWTRKLKELVGGLRRG